MMKRGRTPNALSIIVIACGLIVGVQLGTRGSGTAVRQNIRAPSNTQKSVADRDTADAPVDESGEWSRESHPMALDNGGLATTTPEFVPMHVVETVDGMALSVSDRTLLEPIVVKAQVLATEPSWFNLPGRATPAATMDLEPRNDLDPMWDIFSPVVFRVTQIFRGPAGMTRVVTSIRGGTTADGDLLEVNGRPDSGFSVGSTYMLFAANRLKPGRPAGLQEWEIRGLDIQDALNQGGQSAHFLSIDSWCRYDGAAAYCPDDGWDITVEDLETQVDALTP